jgi:putative Holliday junction resolvase
MKVLAIDYGEKFIGVAIGDTQIAICKPLKVITNKGRRHYIEEIKKILKDTGAEKIVVGIPLSFKMKDTQFTKKVRSFGKILSKELNIPVDFENEILTSQYSARIKKKGKNHIRHSISAALILESWLEKNKV